jgi:deazaflavin-dependent oxidoreductase (nitroreductase family)
MVTRPNAILRFLFLTPTYLYRLRCGWLFGHRFLLLIHVGRRTRLRRYTVLEILEFRRQPPEVIVMSAFGPKADWLRNTRRHRALRSLLWGQSASRQSTALSRGTRQWQ